MKVYDYMVENNMLGGLIDACESEDQKEAIMAYAKDVCEKYEPFLKSIRENVKTKDDRDALLEAIMNSRKRGNADRST